MEVLVNKQDKEADIDKDINNRVKPSLAEVPFEDVYRLAKIMFDKKLTESGNELERIDYQKSFDMRMMETPAGASVNP